MKKVSCNDILSICKYNQEGIIDQIQLLMQQNYPNFVDWFNNKLIPGINNGERNIVYITKGDKIIGFANLTKKQKEKKISNIYINSLFKYKAFFNILIDKSLDWLETDKPVVIMSEHELSKCFYLLLERNWTFTGKTKNNDYILNRKEFFEDIVKKKIHK